MAHDDRGHDDRGHDDRGHDDRGHDTCRNKKPICIINNKLIMSVNYELH